MKVAAAAPDPPPASAHENARWLRAAAHQLGFVAVGFAPAKAVAQHALFEAWLAADYAGDMTYLARDSAARRDPRSLCERARSICAVALSYAHPDPALPAADLGGVRGRIACYARAEDYHLILKKRLQRLAEQVLARFGGEVAHRVCVDSAPLLERAVAAQAGLGFQGKNTLLITPGAGSYTVLGELLLELDLAADVQQAPRCGQCRACLDACPTGALRDAYSLDARRCISYLTIENKGPIPRELRPLLGAWIFGCDLCQMVCPFNGAARPGDAAFRPRLPQALPELLTLLELGAAQFRRFVRRTALRRLGRTQLLRNVAVALGNVGGAAELPAMMRAFAVNPPLVRQHLAWAMAQIGVRHPAAGPQARAQLLEQTAREPDIEVQAELAAALAMI